MGNPLILVAVLLLLLSACSTPAPAPPTVMSVAERVTATMAPTFTPLATATPTATATLYPTYTPYPTFTPPPTATATPIAMAPSTSADWPTTIGRAADALGGNAEALHQELARLGAISAGNGMVRMIDLTNDGIEELLVWYIDPGNPNANTRGNVLLLSNFGNAWRPIFDATFGTAGSEGARLLDARDLNNDRQIEIAYALTSCGVNGCSTSVRVGVWGGTAFRSLTVSEIRLPALRDAIFTDPDGDGRFDMALTGGPLESPEAGPQRERTDVYRWTPGGYALSETLYAATDWLPLVVWEANEALEANDTAGAIALYQRAISDSSLRPWAQGSGDVGRGEAERALLRAFSHLRLMAIYASRGERAVVQQNLEQLRTSYPDSPFRQAAELFVQQWRANAGVRAACRAANEYAAINTPGMVEPLNDFGFTGPQFAPTDICPFE